MAVSLLVDDLPSLPESLPDGRLLFHVALPAREIRIISGCARPADFGHSEDGRRLGVALLGLSWEQGGEMIDTPIDSSAFIDGFQHVEHPATSDEMFRWTNGNAAVPPSLFPPWRGEPRGFITVSARLIIRIIVLKLLSFLFLFVYRRFRPSPGHPAGHSGPKAETDRWRAASDPRLSKPGRHD